MVHAPRPSRDPLAQRRARGFIHFQGQGIYPLKIKIVRFYLESTVAVLCPYP